jgi:hypothetical protein
MPVPLWRTSIRGQARPPLCRPHLEALEGRLVPSTFLVPNTDDAGAGSLRHAVLDANATPGTKEIDFTAGGGPRGHGRRVRGQSPDPHAGPEGKRQGDGSMTAPNDGALMVRGYSLLIEE